MRIVRFLDNDDCVRCGADNGDGTATPLADPRGVLGAGRHVDRRERLAGMNALVADDDANMRELMTTVLSRAGCTCSVCGDGAEAMHALEREPIDFVVSDIAMPHHNGYEIFAAARRSNEHMPVVLVTGFGYDPNHVLVRASREGLDAVLYKPFTPQQLLDEIDHALCGTRPEPADALVRAGEPVAVKRLLAPLVPTNILCVGRNYPTAGGPAPDGRDGTLELFMKPSSAVIGPGDLIRVPDLGDVDPLLDCEGELAVVIGALAHGVSEADARRYVLGYTAANDVTARRWQTGGGAPLWMRGKGFDTFCPLGPAILTPSELADAGDVTVRTLVNGSTVRAASARAMIRSVPALISEMSRLITLLPGSVILTGAPPREPRAPAPAALGPGDRVAVEIDGVGRLENTVG